VLVATHSFDLTIGSDEIRIFFSIVSLDILQGLFQSVVGFTLIRL
jgi:hypothetical protein